MLGMTSRPQMAISVKGEALIAFRIKGRGIAESDSNRYQLTLFFYCYSSSHLAGGHGQETHFSRWIIPS